MSSFYGKKFDKVVQMLRKEFPLGVPIAVKTVKKLRCRDGGELLYGQCSSSSNSKGVVKKFVVEVDRDLPLGLAIDTLLHEWAHATDHLKNGDSGAHPHRNSWGVHYACIWRAYSGE
jgi:hypothetical protein